MISKAKRVPRLLFQTLQNGKKTLHGKAFSLSYSFISSSSEVPRFSCIISKKVAKTAVMRNKLKRRVYEAASSYESRLPLGTVCFFYAKKEATTLSYKDIVSELGELFRHAKLLR